MNHPTSLQWRNLDWRNSAIQWIKSELAAHHLSITGAIEQPHVRPWSTVLKVPTSQGDLYFKASAPVLSHEVRLTQNLAQRYPVWMPHLVAVDPEQGWMLMKDGGSTLRSWVGDNGYLGHWLRIMTIYAELQIAMVEHQSELLRDGAFDRRLVLLPGLLESLLQDKAALLLGESEGLTRQQYRQLLDHVPSFEQLCYQLSGFGIPESLQHDDFHDNNIFVHSKGYTFFDWEETCLAHPFFTMVVTPRSVAYQLGIENNDPRLKPLRDAYLKPLELFAGRPALTEAYKLANRIGMVNRALTWYEILKSLAEPDRMGESSEVPGWLQEYLEASGDLL